MSGPRGVANQRRVGVDETRAHGNRIADRPIHPARARMAPKAIMPETKKATAMAPIHVKTDRVKVSEISIGADSGWRDLTESHVEELKATIMQGDFGQTVMAKPSLLLNVSEQPVQSTWDGNYVINNGKHFVAALKGIDKYLTELQPDEPPEWLVPELARVFAEGLLVDWYKYPVDDRLIHSALQCLAHEQEQNRYRVSTIGDKVAIMKKTYLDSGSDWTKAKSALMGVLGAQKATTIQRWIQLARDVDEDVLSWIVKKLPTLSQSYLVGNEYIIGKGDEARARMGAKYAVAALELLAEQLEVGKKGAVSANMFVAEYCAPLRTLEAWEKAQIQRFGVVATGFASFHRVVRSAGLQNGEL